MRVSHIPNTGSAWFARPRASYPRHIREVSRVPGLDGLCVGLATHTKTRPRFLTIMYGAGRTDSPALANPIAQRPSKKEMVYSGAQSPLSEIDLISSTSVLLGGVIPSPSSTAQVRPGEQRPQRGELRHRGLYDDLGPEGVRPLCKASGRGFCGGQARLHVVCLVLRIHVFGITSYIMYRE